MTKNFNKIVNIKIKSSFKSLQLFRIQWISSLILLLFSFLIIGCAKKDETEIILDNSEPLALAPDVQWAVVSEPYAAFKESKDWSASVIGHCRKGDVLQIKGKSLDSKNEVWYYFEQGWLHSSSVLVYSNRLRAQNYASQIEK
mgnify:CR=1 FL=1